VKPNASVRAGRIACDGNWGHASAGNALIRLKLPLHALYPFADNDDEPSAQDQDGSGATTAKIHPVVPPEVAMMSNRPGVVPEGQPTALKRGETSGCSTQSWLEERHWFAKPRVVW